MSTLRRLAPTLPLVPLLLSIGVAAHAQEDRWFTNVAAEVGLSGQRAKDCIFTDLDGDGYYDLCLDRQRLYLSEAGRRFTPHEHHGIEFPVVRVVPMAGDGSPQEDKAQEKPFVPHYLYFADLDNDGDQDAVWGVHANWEFFDRARGGWRSVEACDPGLRSHVWLNDGKGRFRKAKPSGFSAPDAFGPAMALALVDVDLDGRLDLYEGREYRQYGVLEGCGVDRLWRGDGKGGFEDVTEAFGLMTVAQPAGARSSRPTYGVTHADWNNDGYPDLLQLSYGRQWNYLWRNDEGKGFTDVGMETMFAGDDITHGRYPDFVVERTGRRPERPFRSNGNTFDCAVGDYDNDGDLDLFLGEIQHAWAGEASDPPSVLENLGEEEGWRFARHPVQAFLPPRTFRDPANFNYGDLHAGWADFDNDGRLDLLIGSGDYPDGQFLRLYHQQEDGSFTEATEVAGFDWEGCGDLSLGDYDRDGDVDILAGRSFMRLNQAHRDRFMEGIQVNEVGLFRNDVANESGHHWVIVHLVGKRANRSGIGARITIEAGDVTRIREIRSGSGLANHQDPPEAHFGLGTADRIERLTVRWPDAGRTVQTFEDLPVDRFVTITQGRRRPALEEAR
ncbi:MAG: CRTAC1 family protein [Planctomycetota bacterium]|jgi:hypothetical protein